MHFNENDLLLNRYRLKDLIGRGGFSVVYRAHDEITGVELAIKIYAPDKGLDEKGIRQFIKEYSLTQPLNHPNLLKATHYDVIPDINAPFLVMPFAKNGSLSSSLDDGQTLNEDRLAKLMEEIGSALDYLHHRNPPIIHQDIKPDNILIGNDGQYMLTDFGISNKMRSTLRKATVSESALTVAYAPPEKYTNQGITPASDIFSFGVMMFECLTDELPWGGDGGVMLLSGAHPPQLPDAFPERLNAILQACMDVDPAKRPAAGQLNEIAKFYQQNGFWPKPEEFLNPQKSEEKPVSRSRGRKTEMMSPADMEEKAAAVAAGASGSGGGGGAKTVRSMGEMNDPLKKPKKKSKAVLLVVIAIVLSGSLIGGYFALKAPTKKPDNPVPIAENEDTGKKNEIIIKPVVIEEDTGKTGKSKNPVIEPKKEEKPVVNPPKKEEPAPAPPINKGPSLESILSQAKEAFGDEDYASAMRLYKQASDQGSGEASWYVGYMYREGLGVSKDYNQALRYYKKSGDQGDPDGYNSYGFMYDRGMGVSMDEAKAFEYYMKAAKMGLAVAQFNVGYYLDEGMGGLSQDWKQAAYWYEKGASGNKLAQRKIGEFYLFGVGGKPKSSTEAFRWFEKAAAAGDEIAANHLKVLKEMKLNREKYSTNNVQRDQMWVRPKAGDMEAKTLSRPGLSTGYKVYYKLSGSQTIQIFPLYKDEREKRGIKDAIDFSNYSSCEILTENSGVHEVSISYEGEGKRSIGYFYIIGFTEGSDMLLQIPTAVCWEP